MTVSLVPRSGHRDHRPGECVFKLAIRSRFATRLNPSHSIDDDAPAQTVGLKGEASIERVELDLLTKTECSLPNLRRGEQFRPPKRAQLESQMLSAALIGDLANDGKQRKHPRHLALFERGRWSHRKRELLKGAAPPVGGAA
ncbi:MAG: hypothetical protein GY822_03590 [Deltaproteobacteria bacterium]|nr:hypothetical protein [Deltaproteobacteria bacterium]